MAKYTRTGLVFGIGLIAVGGMALVLANSRAAQAVSAMSAAIPDRPDWNWDVAPILSQNCFACHGQMTQKAGLRLDTQKGAYTALPDNPGHRAIVPGSAERSELFRRITAADPALAMPPTESHKTLSSREVAIIRRWIEQGAHYAPHWAYITPAIVRPDKTKWDARANNEIDRFVYARMAREGLNPSPEADRETLINRVYLDLTGLPPPLKEVDDFVASKDPQAYEKIVDRLLASTEYAERQANIWLDVARYADSRGGLNDDNRPLSFPYRDWLISAFKRNLPYDQFVTWQLAGDKLPNPTREQLLATAFLKSGRQDLEGGAIDEEFRMNYAEERTELIGKDFLGLTVGCAKCHDHKYDVVSQADYYSMTAFFNQMDEGGAGSGSRGTPTGATLEWPTAQQSKALAAAHAVTAAKERAYQTALAAARQRLWVKAADAAAPSRRIAAVQAAILADTQAYYPLDSGYMGDFRSLYVDRQILGPGALDQGIKDKYEGEDRAELTGRLQKQIVADVTAGKAVPSLTGPNMAQGTWPIISKFKPGQKHPPLSAQPFRPALAYDMAAAKADPGLPRQASREVDWALEQLIAYGYLDARLGEPARISKRELQPFLKPDALLWTDSGLPNGKKAYLSNVTFVPGHKGQGIKIHDSVFSMDPRVGQFERTQPYSLDFWMKLPTKPYVDPTRPDGPSATILYNSGIVGASGYELSMANNKLSYSIVHNSPHDMLQVVTKQDAPTGRWVHITSTYDGNSKASGMHLYIDGKEAPVEVQHDHLTRSSAPFGVNAELLAYFHLASGTAFQRPELTDGALDEVRVLTRELTPLEVAYLQDPAAATAVSARQAQSDVDAILTSQDPTVRKARQEMTDARLNEQTVETQIDRIMIAGDQPLYRKSFVLDRGIYNAHRQEVQPRALSRVFPWSAGFAPNRLGLAQWLFDPRNPLTARVYMNRVWQAHFGNGIVTTVDDFGMQGANPTNPQLLDYLAVEFQRSGWDIKHMNRQIVLSATYRQASNTSPANAEKDPRNLLLERGPRFRLPAEVLRDNALAISGLLDRRVGGDSVFPYAPDAIWDGVATGFTVYPTLVSHDQMYRRSMYTFVKRNAPVANLVPFDMPDRRDTQVARPTSNTPLQALVMLNDTQFVEAYRKLAERAIKVSADPDQQLAALWRLAVRHRPDALELQTLRAYRAAEAAEMQASPAKVDKILSIGVSAPDPSVDRAQLAAMTVVAASAMNTPDAYTQH